MFPEITNWTDPQNQYRNANIHSLSHQQWLWFHPSAFKLIKFGTPGSALVTFGAAGIVLHFNGNAIGSYVFGFFVLVMIYEIIRMIKHKVVKHDTNMYDTFMREGEF